MNPESSAENQKDVCFDDTSAHSPNLLPKEFSPSVTLFTAEF